MLEVEAKVRVADPDAVRRRILSAGARSLGLRVEQDTFFAHPARDFVATDEALRLRSVVAAGGAALALELTYKGPRSGATGVKAREEQTVALRDDPTPLLQSLGFAPAARLSKRREVFEMGDAHITLDQVDGLGWFVEVEVLAAQASHVQQAGARVESVLQALGLASEPRIAQSYLEMAEKARPSKKSRLAD